ncbi:MAG: hypothetical protein AAGF85_00615 [Bacteroidota bacterium]
MGMDISQIVAEFEARYQNQGQTARDIKKQLFEPSTTESYFRLIPWDQDYYRSSYADIDEVTQAFSVPFVAKSTSSFAGHEQKLGEFKIDVLRTPDKLRRSWLGFLVNIAEKDRSKWPIIRWMITEQIIPKSKEEMEIQQSYWGWEVTGYNASPTVDGATFVRQLIADNVVSPANAAVDGIRKQIIKLVADGRANVLNSGAWSTDPVTFVEEIEAWVLLIPRVHRDKMDFLFMSEALRNRYIDGRREKYNMNYAQETDLEAIDKVSMKVKMLPGMDGSEKIWTTMPMNRVRPVHEDNTGRFDIQKLDRQVKLLNDWKMVLTVDVPEFVYTNDLENAITAGDITARY